MEDEVQYDLFILNWSLSVNQNERGMDVRLINCLFKKLKKQMVWMEQCGFFFSWTVMVVTVARMLLE